MPGAEKGLHGVETPSTDNPRPSVVLPTDDWALIRRGWSNAGTLPALGSPAWRTLPDDDPVKVATVAAVRLGVLDLVNAHGPAYARCRVSMQLEAA